MNTRKAAPSPGRRPLPLSPAKGGPSSPSTTATNTKTYYSSNASPATATTAGRSISTPPYLSDTMRSEVAEWLRTDIRNFSSTPDPIAVPLQPYQQQQGMNTRNDNNKSSSSSISAMHSGVGSHAHSSPQRMGLSMKDRSIAAFRSGGSGFGGGGGDDASGGYIPPPNAMLRSNGQSYSVGGSGGGRQQNSVPSPFQSRRGSLQQQHHQRRARSPAEGGVMGGSPSPVILAPLNLPAIRGADGTTPQRREASSTRKGGMSPRGVAGKSPRSPRRGGGGGGSKSPRGAGGGGAKGGAAVAINTNTANNSRATTSHSHSNGGKSTFMPFRKRRNVPNNNGTSIFTDYANSDAALALAVLKDEEARDDADTDANDGGGDGENGGGGGGRIVRKAEAHLQAMLMIARNTEGGSPLRALFAGLGSPTAARGGGGVASPSSSLLPPLPASSSTTPSRSLGAASVTFVSPSSPFSASTTPTTATATAKKATSSSPAFSPRANAALVDRDLAIATASLSTIKDSIKKNEKESKEAHAKAFTARMIQQNGGTAEGLDPSQLYEGYGNGGPNGNGDGRDGNGKKNGGGAGNHHGNGVLMSNARLLAEQEAFEAWQKVCDTKLIDGKDAPIFRTIKAFKHGPKSSIGVRVHELREDPTKWYEFSANVAQLRKDRIRDSLAKGSFMQDNVGRLGSFSPERRLPALEAMGAERDRKIAEAAEKRKDLRVMQLASIEQKAEERTERINSRVTKLMSVIVMGATAARLKEALDRHRAEQETMAKKHAVSVFEQMWRRRNCQMSYARAFTVRARFLRRVLTRIRAKIMMDRHADRVVNLLKNVTFYTRILVAFSHFHGRVVKGQRLWRTRVAMISMQGELRRMQWEDTAQRRAADIVMHIGRLRAERGIRGGASNSASFSVRSNSIAPNRLSVASHSHQNTNGPQSAVSASAFASNINRASNAAGAAAASSPTGRQVMTLGSVMLPSRSNSLASMSTSRSAGGGRGFDEDPLVAAEIELEDLRAITDDMRDAILENYLSNQRKQFRQELRKRDEYIAALNKPLDVTGMNSKEVAQKRLNIPPKPRWKMVLSDEVVVNMIRQATRHRRQSQQVSGGSSFAFLPSSGAVNTLGGSNTFQ